MRRRASASVALGRYAGKNEPRRTGALTTIPRLSTIGDSRCGFVAGVIPFRAVTKGNLAERRIPGSFGAVAQLGERCVRNAEVEGSTPFRSTTKPLVATQFATRGFLLVSDTLSF